MKTQGNVDAVAPAELIARAFVEARRTATGLARYPGPTPASLAEGYAVQSHAIRLHGEAIGGWKVGRIPAPLIARFGANRLAGPIFAGGIVDAVPGLEMPVYASGFAAAEAEFLLRIGTAPDPAKTQYSHAEAAALLDAVHLGIEIASSPYPGINADGPAVTVSDFGNNHGLVVGPALADWHDMRLLDMSVRLLIDGEEAGAATAATMLDGPIGAAAFLFELAAARGIALRPGQWISSGAVTGVHEVVPGQRVTACFGDDIEVVCRIVAARGAP